MLYDNYIKNLSEKFERRLQEITAVHNFELGNEFEIAICDILREFLPTKYGICRGFVVDYQGNKAGDDIIIYDQERFPTLKVNKKNDFSRKEEIPIEAVYAYIEAKHKLTEEVLDKAISQIKDVKDICNSRVKMGLGQFDPYISVKRENTSKNEDYPEFRNPIFTLIISRFFESNDKKTEYDEVKGFFIHHMNELSKKKLPSLPEMIVAGKDLSASVCYKLDTGQLKLSKFLLEDKDFGITAIRCKGYAFGIGLANLAHALDWIRLGKMPWNDMLNEIVKNKDQK
jgi:hypothetical protein